MSFSFPPDVAARINREGDRQMSAYVTALVRRDIRAEQFANHHAGLGVQVQVTPERAAEIRAALAAAPARAAEAREQARAWVAAERARHRPGKSDAV